jgi:hypothetical protein
MGPYAGVDYNSLYLYLIVKSTPWSAIHPQFKGKGVDWGRSFLLVEHVCICLLISKQTIGKGRVRRREGEGARADLMSLNIDI